MASTDEYCLICLDVIVNEFSILTCNCKTIVFHNKCINTWLTRCNKCPQCIKKFCNKPQNLGISNLKKLQIFSSFYNVMRIIEGYPYLAYTS